MALTLAVAATSLSAGAGPAPGRPGEQLLEWSGDGADDHLGWSVGRLPDLDGDGLPDLLITTPGSDAAGADAGRVRAHSSSTGEVLWTASGEPGEALGTRLAESGDIDGDGSPDILAGGIYVAYVLSGVDGARIRRIVAPSTGTPARSAVADLGDVDDDGYADYAVGEPHTGGTGRVTAYSGHRGLVLWRTFGERGSDLGHALGTSPDLNEDGVRDLIASAPRAEPTGQVRVLSGADGSALLGPLRPDDDEDAGNFGFGRVGAMRRADTVGIWVADAADTGGTGKIYVFDLATGERLPDVMGDAQGERFGTGVAVADVDSDGLDDFVVGAIGSETGNGSLSLVSGRRSRILVRFVSETGGEQYGFAVRDLGDVTGDGATDYLVSAPWNGESALRAGKAYLVSGDPRRTFGCRRIRSIVARCRPRNLFIKARTSLRRGVLELLVDGEPVTMELNPGGKGKLRLPPEALLREVVVARCPKIERSADCR